MASSRRTVASSLEELYRARFGEFLRVATAITGDRESGRDAVQDAFARLFRDRAAYRADGPVAGWAWKAVVRTAGNARRRRNVEERHAAQRSVSTHNGSTPDSDVRELVSVLPEHQRLAVFLRYYADLDYAGIAQALDIREGTVAATLSKAHAALRAKLQEVQQ